MTSAAKRKSISPPGLSALWTILLLVVALCLPETRVWGFGITPQPASGVFESASPLSIGEFTTAIGYDASDSLLAARGIPEVRFSAGRYPELAENITHAQRAGHPSVLTHGGNSAANRAAALDGVPNIRPLSRDEYPFASSLQGGAGSWVGHVPVSQQNAQGAILKNFFKQNNIKPGDQYRVIVEP